MLYKHQDPQIPSQMSFGRFFVHLAGYTFSQIEANQWKQQSKVPVFVFFWLDNLDYGIRHHMPAWHPSDTVLLVIWIGETLNLLCNNAACEICHNPLLHVQWLWLVGIVARQTHHLSLKYFQNWCQLQGIELETRYDSFASWPSNYSPFLCCRCSAARRCRLSEWMLRCGT